MFDSDSHKGITIPGGFPTSCGSDLSDFDGHADRLYIYKPHMDPPHEYYFFVEEESRTLYVLIATGDKSFHILRGAQLLEIFHAVSKSVDTCFFEHVGVVFLVSFGSSLKCVQHVHNNLTKTVWCKDRTPQMVKEALDGFENNQYIVELSCEENDHSSDEELEEEEVGSGYFGHRLLGGGGRGMHSWFL
jgi:hypothetical protein